jgi:hypothetical protein
MGIIKIVCPVCHVTHPKGINSCPTAKRLIEQRKREKMLRKSARKQRLKVSQFKGRIIPFKNALK